MSISRGTSRKPSPSSSQSGGGLRRRFACERRRFSSRRRSRDAAVGLVATRRRSTRRAARSAATRRSTASSRLRSWLRSSCATARNTGPAFAMTRRFCAADNASDASTSKTASTRVSDFCACWPPGPLDRDVRHTISRSGRTTERVTRIDSPSMAAILLDVDGVLHVSGQPIPGAAAAVHRLRGDGHRLRFVTNTTTRSRARLAEELRTAGIEAAGADVQTTADAAVTALRGRRVFALVMQGLVGDLEGIELVGDSADAVLIGGADETPETNLVFSYMNLARAFAELELGASLYCLHRNRWWQTARGPLLDAGAFVALDADPELTWMVGEDLESDIAGPQAMKMHT